MSSLIAPSKRDIQLLVKRTHADGSSPSLTIMLDFTKFKRMIIKGRLLLNGATGAVTTSRFELRNSGTVYTANQSFRHVLNAVVVYGTAGAANQFTIDQCPRDSGEGSNTGIVFEYMVEKNDDANGGWYVWFRAKGSHTSGAPIHIELERMMRLSTSPTPDRVVIESNGNGNWRNSSYYEVYGEKTN